jgi:cysteinyl-tRNA synthetase
MYLVSGHYRQPLAFSPDELEEAESRIQRIREALHRLDPGSASPPDMRVHRDSFFAALASDFNMPAALDSLFKWVREANRRGAGVGDADLREMLAVLGFSELEPLVTAGAGEEVDPAIRSLLEERTRARADRDFERADRLREELLSLGWEIRDGPAGPELVPAARQ